MMNEPTYFGLIVIGDEVLNGKRTDAHFAHFKGQLSERGHALRWHWLLPDDPDVLVDQLGQSMARPDPVFICGGIGATPDDHTRVCAATAAGLALTQHPDAAALIVDRFGDDAYPHRIRMADLPAGCGLIPNPIGRIPGFMVDRHYFLPGFPQMAWPMADWVLDQRYPTCDALQCERSVRVTGIPESGLIPLMEELGRLHGEVKFFSLPHLGPERYIQLGLRGRADVDAAFDDLCRRLREQAIEFSVDGVD